MCDALKQYREASGLTQDEMAGRIGVSQAAYCRYEKGERIPRAAVMRQIHTCTGGQVPPGSFFADEFHPFPSHPEADHAA